MTTKTRPMTDEELAARAARKAEIQSHWSEHAYTRSGATAEGYEPEPTPGADDATEAEPAAPKGPDPALVEGNSDDVKERIAAAERSDQVEAIVESERARSRPRAGVLDAAAARLEELGE